MRFIMVAFRDHYKTQFLSPLRGVYEKSIGITVQIICTVI